MQFTLRARMPPVMLGAGSRQARIKINIFTYVLVLVNSHENYS